MLFREYSVRKSQKNDVINSTYISQTLQLLLGDCIDRDSCFFLDMKMATIPDSITLEIHAVHKAVKSFKTICSIQLVFQENF